MSDAGPRVIKDTDVVAALTESWVQNLPDGQKVPVWSRFIAINFGKRVGFRRYVSDEGTPIGRRTALLVHSVYKAWRAQYDAYVRGDVPWSSLGQFEDHLPHLKPSMHRVHRVSFFHSVLLYEAQFGPGEDRKKLVRDRIRDLLPGT